MVLKTAAGKKIAAGPAILCLAAAMAMDTLGGASTPMKTAHSARPFVKWAGGKTQLLPHLVRRLPPGAAEDGCIPEYIEPFAGGGALFFHLAQSLEIGKAVLIDANRDLVLAYGAVQKRPDDLIACLRSLEEAYLAEGSSGRKAMYYRFREEFNAQPFPDCTQCIGEHGVRRTALFLFLNRTCYNGLYRQNRRGFFNVPHGSYKAPVICPEPTIRAASGLLQCAEIRCGDFETAAGLATERTFVYLDPPYRPLSGTARFTSYAKESFNDQDQIRLAAFYSKLHQRGAKLMLSNSDPTVTDPDDDFFHRLYGKFHIHRVPARRSINCNGQRRGAITELIITNYAVDGDNEE